MSNLLRVLHPAQLSWTRRRRFLVGKGPKCCACGLAPGWVRSHVRVPWVAMRRLTEGLPLRTPGLERYRKAIEDCKAAASSDPSSLEAFLLHGGRVVRPYTLSGVKCLS
jgi:hypothetical protein